MKRVLSLDRIDTTDNENCAIEPADPKVATRPGYLHDDGATIAEIRKTIDKASFVLTQAEKTIINSRFFRHLTLEQTGAEMGITRQRVEQVQKIALAKLREYMTDERKEPKCEP